MPTAAIITAGAFPVIKGMSMSLLGIGTRNCSLYTVKNMFCNYAYIFVADLIEVEGKLPSRITELEIFAQL
jgi:hypothetical protein